MNTLRFRLSSQLWLVAIAAAFLGGIRYGEYRPTARTKVTFRQNGVVTTIVSPAELKLVLKPHTGP